MIAFALYCAIGTLIVVRVTPEAIDELRLDHETLSVPKLFFSLVAAALTWPIPLIKALLR